MRRFRTACAVVLSVLAFDAATAVQHTLREPPHGSRAYDAVDAELTLAEFSDCVLERGGRRARAERFLRQQPTGEPFENAAERLMPEECLQLRGGSWMEMRIRSDALRASLFASLYRRDFSHAPPQPQVSETAPLRLSDEFEGDPALIPQTVRTVRAIGDCAARADPVGTHAFLLTTLGSSEERQALAPVTSALANCLPEGQQLRFSRAMLRGILAEALYKLRRVAAGQAPVPTETRS
ncbi:MAG TPA: hypothetical protein VF704_06515 [Allosphingosinicella sp.]|jgi:hypothetical protein